MFVAVSLWAEHQGPSLPLAALSGLLCMQHLTLGFLLAVARPRPWIREALEAAGSSMEEVLMARLMHCDGMAAAVSHCMPALDGNQPSSLPTLGPFPPPPLGSRWDLMPKLVRNPPCSLSEHWHVERVTCRLP